MESQSSRREGDVHRHGQSSPPAGAFPFVVHEAGPTGSIEIATFMWRHDAEVFCKIAYYTQPFLIYSVEER